MRIHASEAYGRIQAGYEVMTPDSGYVAVVGGNNSGKSTLLQFVFKKLYEVQEVGTDKIAFLSPERSYIHPSHETNNKQLQIWNAEFYQQTGIQTAPIQYDGSRGPSQADLPKMLTTHGGNFVNQVNKINQYLEEVGFQNFVVGESFNIVFPDGRVDTMGTGLRSVFGILSALADKNLKAILIDEPELFLEPRVQKALRDLLIREAEERLIMVSTHSHLLLDRETPSANWVVRVVDGYVSHRPVDSKDELMDITFQLLGNDTYDLFFPGNYLIVEGVSDQVVFGKVAQLMGVPSSQVKIIAAGGDARAKNALSAVQDSLRPLVGGSPYEDRVVVLVDQPKRSSKLLTELKAMIGVDRVFVLKETSLEEELSGEIFALGGFDKDIELEKLQSARDKGDSKAAAQIKRQLSDEIAANLKAEHLGDASLSRVREALEKAASLASS